MGEISDNIKATFSNMVRIYEEMASLLLDADDLMTRNGYRPLKGSAIESAYSKSLNHPRWWMTLSGARYYVSDEDPMVAKAIGFFFFNSRLEPIDPVIVFSTMCGSEEGSEGEVNPSWVLWEAWTKGVSDQALDKEHTFTNIKSIRQGKISGVLLENVVDQTSLELLVINPLLSMSWK